MISSIAIPSNKRLRPLILFATGVSYNPLSTNRLLKECNRIIINSVITFPMKVIYQCVNHIYGCSYSSTTYHIVLWTLPARIEIGTSQTIFFPAALYIYLVRNTSWIAGKTWFKYVSWNNSRLHRKSTYLWGSKTVICMDVRHSTDLIITITTIS